MNIPYIIVSLMDDDARGEMLASRGLPMIMLVLLLTSVVSWGYWKHDRSLRRKFLLERDLRKQKAILAARLNSLDKILTGKIKTDDQIKTWLIKDYTALSSLPVVSKDRPLSSIPLPNVISISDSRLNNEVAHAMERFDCDIIKCSVFDDWFVQGALALYHKLELGASMNASALVLEKFTSFSSRVFGLYRSTNPFHNAMHALDVANTAALLLMSNPVIFQSVPQWERLALLVSTLCIDVDHPARNNAFLVQSHHQLAVTYNDRSVLENHHAAVTFRELLKDEQSFVDVLIGADVFPAFRELVIRLILATDMSLHFQFQSMLDETIARGVYTSSDSFLDPDARQLMLQALIKVSDVGHFVKDLEVSKEWIMRMKSEQLEQGDEELARGLPVSPFSDRTKGGVAKYV